MNPYLKHLNKIEFVATLACTGRCKHCSQGDHSSGGEKIDPRVAAEAVEKVTAAYDIQTVMVFGGEPLLHREAVFAIMKAAQQRGVPRRQLITNGCFTAQPQEIRRVAAELFDCGVNDLLLSVDAFHQETIPLDVVKEFAREAQKAGIPLRLQPAWLVSPEDENPYNRKTREILEAFSDLGIWESAGNVIFPEGNALRYFSEYFKESAPENPYREDPFDVRCLSVSPNGDLLEGNLYRQDVMEILRAYAP